MAALASMLTEGRTGCELGQINDGQHWLESEGEPNVTYRIRKNSLVEDPYLGRDGM